MNYVSFWRKMKGKRGIDITLLINIAEVLETSIGYLFGETNDEKNNNIVLPPIDKKVKERSLKEDKGIMTYTFSESEKIEMPAMPEFLPTFERMVTERLTKTAGLNLS